MNSISAALLVNLIGFTVGVALYGLIAAMVLRYRRWSALESVDKLLLTTALLGLVWNFVELYTFIRLDFVPGSISPWVTALSFSALGFLPSVVVHSAQADDEGTHWLTYAAYALSVFAAALHFYGAASGGSAPSDIALETQTIGAVLLAGCLLLFNLKQTLEKKTIWASALLVFAVSSLHLSGEREGNSWIVELVAHQASLPLALTILYQNYRFAFADLFLKRAISLILLSVTAFGLYNFVAAPLLRYHETHDRNDALAVSLILTLWIITALIYPLLYRLAIWLVDTVLLRRADYAALRIKLAGDIETLDSIDDVLEMTGQRLADVLTARSMDWHKRDEKPLSLDFVAVSFSPNEARILIPTAELPCFEVRLGDLYGGRRLLSDEIATLQAVAIFTARRIDALRVEHERYEQRFREQEFAKLAAEAQLTALRSQINPHFLFNSLTTIGYLIEAQPVKAYDTLIRLTRLLRSVLSSTGEFCSLGEEIRLIESYLEIEHARFEEKLTIEIDVPTELRDAVVPALILQPLVENAVKHGISENRKGGTVRIKAALAGSNGDQHLELSVWDSGAGRHLHTAAKPAGVGLRNIRERLESYYGETAKFSLTQSEGGGTEAVVEIPLKGKRSK